MTETLQYMPLRFRLYRPAWRDAGLMTLAGVCIGVAMQIAAGRWDDPGILFLSIIYLAPCAILTLVFYFIDLALECRIEGGTLSFRSWSRRRLTQFAIAELKEINRIDDGGNGASELVFIDGRRLLIEGKPLAAISHAATSYRRAHDIFVEAIHEVNPAVMFGHRNLHKCHVCGAPKKYNYYHEDRCGQCETSQPPRLRNT